MTCRSECSFTVSRPRPRPPSRAGGSRRRSALSARGTRRRQRPCGRVVRAVDGGAARTLSEVRVEDFHPVVDAALQQQRLGARLRPTRRAKGPGVAESCVRTDIGRGGGHAALERDAPPDAPPKTSAAWRGRPGACAPRRSPRRRTSRDRRRCHRGRTWPLHAHGARAASGDVHPESVLPVRRAAAARPDDHRRAQARRRPSKPEGRLPPSRALGLSRHERARNRVVVVRVLPSRA